MKAAIIEDEKLPAEKLEHYLRKCQPDIEILAMLGSVEEAVSWLEKNQGELDLIFMDIQLGERLCFEIFERVDLQKPVIFTTAYDEYAIDAFKVNSIDYLLKPITYSDLTRALKKVENMRFQLSGDTSYGQIFQQLQQRKYKTRFIVKSGNHLHSVRAEDIGMFVADGRILYLISLQNKKYIIDFKLQELEELLDPQKFFRVNRSYIINIAAIRDVLVYSNSRLKIKSQIDLGDEIIVSRERVGDFKNWFAGE